IGDTIAGDPESVVGRIIQTTLGEILNDYSRQNVKMKLRISNVAADAAYTEFVGHELTRDYLRSLVKRRTTRIDSHVPVLTKDGKMVDLSVTCYTLTRANLSQTHAIRGLLFSKTQDLAKEGDFNALLNGIVTGDISKELFKTIKPLFPVRRVEVIKSKVGITRAA
ncbi:MAG TPA: 30S ribosomal protein S3ae, partial [Methanoregulaceae archaeon]|nr:30S ribosomal protein S3ae [Methanoregulaceae archaeon]